MRGAWKAPSGGIVRMLCALCIPSWLINFAKPSLKVAQVVEVVFNMKESPQPLDFIMKVSLKDSELAPI